MPQTLNPAVKANLERVIDEVRWAAARRMAWVRLVIAGVAVLIFFAIPSTYATGPSRWGCLAFLFASVAALVLPVKFPRLRPWAALSVAMVDLPIVAVTQYVQSLYLPVVWYILPANVALMCLGVSLSTLSLSRGIIGITAALAAPVVAWMNLRAGLPWQPVILVSTIPLCIAAVGFGVVSRIRALVQTARLKDLLGKYVLGERLGVGGMAEVFLATYSPEGGFERRVAIKRMLPSLASEHDAVALFRREAELGAMLAHPNIVQVLDFGADEGSYFMALEYVDGLPLSRLLTASRKEALPLPIAAVVTMAISLAEALDHLHTRTGPDGRPLELIHRDLNPPNVLISSLGEVKLSDLGIARGVLSTQLTQEGMMRGKIAYSPPEQILGQGMDHRVDLFALGVTLHEALTSHRLFRGTDPAEIARAVITEAIPPPSDLRADIPAEVEHLVMSLIERDRERRTPSARALLEGLRALPTPLRAPDQGRSALAERVARSRVALPEMEPEAAVTGSESEPPARADRDPTRTQVARPSSREPS